MNDLGHLLVEFRIFLEAVPPTSRRPCLEVMLVQGLGICLVVEITYFAYCSGSVVGDNP